MNLATILDDCLQRLQAGETIAGCLAHYPDHAADLAPMLGVAAQLNRLVGQQPTENQRQRTLARLRQTAAQQRTTDPRQARAGWLKLVFAAPRLAVAASVFLLLLVSLSAGVVASSQPGQPAYELRVIAERAPALVVFQAPARAVAELDIADRRLSDLQAHLTETGQVESAALRALLAGDRAAAQQALASDREQRLLVIERLSARARLLHQLAATAPDAAVAMALAEASRNTWRLVERIQSSLAAPPSSGEPNDAGGALTATPAAAPVSTATPSLTTNTSSATISATATWPSPSPSMAWTATSTASATSAPGTPHTPRPRPGLTALAQTATVQTQMPSPSHTPRPGSTAPAQTATAAAGQTAPAGQTPRPRQTPASQTATSPAQTPRPRLTAQAQTATAQAQTTTPEPATTPTLGEPQPTQTDLPGPTSAPQPTNAPEPTRPGPGPGPGPGRP